MSPPRDPIDPADRATDPAARIADPAPPTVDPGPVDPDRIAVALRYDAPAAPTVVATGRGHVANEILRRAAEAGVTIEENPALAAALSRLDVDEHIPEALYKAVAEVIALVLRAAREGSPPQP